MGDHRADIKITFHFHGKDYKMDSWINYDGWDGPDRSVIEFFENAWEDGLWRFQEEDRKAEEKRKKREAEERDKKEYKRLKEKYEEQPQEQESKDDT